MLRFIVKRSFRDGYNAMSGDDYITLDIDVPELEQELSRGGFSETSFERSDLIGVERLPCDDSPAPKEPT